MSSDPRKPHIGMFSSFVGSGLTEKQRMPQSTGRDSCRPSPIRMRVNLNAGMRNTLHSCTSTRIPTTRCTSTTGVQHSAPVQNPTVKAIGHLSSSAKGIGAW